MWKAELDTFFGTETTFEEADIVIFGAPFDSTTSFRPGTRFASKVMRSESYGLENYSPYQDKDLSELPFFDSGDLELPIGDTACVLDAITDRTKIILNAGKLPLMIGGEHLVTLSAVRACAEKYPDLHVIHFDAHADLREDYLGVKLSHATVMHRIWDILGDDRIYQFGIRSGDREEIYWGRDHVFTQQFNFEGLAEVVKKLAGKPVYFTLDLDILDPSVFPGTGTPEAGGVTFIELLKAVLCVAELRPIGCDMNELCPVYDQSGASTAVALKILREMLLAFRRP